MKKLFLAVFLISITATFAQSGSKNFIDQNYIEVTGLVETEITPDEIYISIVINEKDKKGRVSVEKQENKMLEKLKQLGVDLKKDLKVLDFSSNYKFFFLKKTDILKSKKYQLIVHEGLQLAKVFQALESIDISNTSIYKVGHSQLEEHKRKAKIKALKQAKEKATDYANAVDQTVGRVLFIQEMNTQHMNYRNNPMLNEVAVSYGVVKKEMDQVNDIEFEKIKIYASVLARIELK
jgi:uncharacterized protein YggE